MRIWIAIPVFNRINYTLKCLESLYNQSYRQFEIVVCDHGSTDNTSRIISEKYPDVIVLNESSDLWWTGATNCCVRYILEHASSDKDLILTLNNDLEVGDDYLSTLLDVSLRNPQSIVTSSGYDINSGKMIESGSILSWVTSKTRKLKPVNNSQVNECNIAEVTHAPGRGTLVPIEVFREIGLYDERHLPHYGADYDFTLRARKNGYKVYISYCSKVFSHVEATGMTAIRSKFGWSSFRKYLLNIKSPANIYARWWLAYNNCPRLLLPTFISFDLLFVIGSYFKYYLFSNDKK